MADVFHFGEFQLDRGAFELRRGGSVIPVEPLVFDLLAFLLRHPGVVLSREKLVDSVWKGRIVSDSTISTAIKSARRALGDTGRDQRYIRTVRGRGVQFAVPVAPVDPGGPTDQAAHPQPTLYLRPFDTMGETGLDPVCRVLRIRAGSILSRIPLLRIATAFVDAEQLMDPRSFRSRFAITHLLDVRLQRVGAKLIAHAALTDTHDGLQIWAREFETKTGPGDQEVLLHQMIRRLEPRLMQMMAFEMQADNGVPRARALLIQAIALLALKGWHRTTFVAATQMIREAIALNPNLALSYAHLALLTALGHRMGLLANDEETVPAVVAAVEKTLALENQDSTILGLVGCALADVGHAERALPILEKAIETNPQNGHAKTALGALFLTQGDHAAAVRYLSDGIACSPADSRSAVWGAALALALLAQGQLDKALEAAEKACREDDRLYLPRLSLAAAHLERKSSAHTVAAIRECLRTKPDLNKREVIAFLGKKHGTELWPIIETSRKRSSTHARPPQDSGTR